MRKVLIPIFVALLAVMGVLTMNRQMNKQQKSLTRNINVVLAGAFDLPLVPEDISTVAKYHIHYNLWDTLVTHSKRDGIAKTFRMDANQRDYFFDLDPAAKFSNGRQITASDVAFSINRLIKLGSDGHANPRELIEKVETLSESSLRIRLAKPVPAFLYLLSLPEYGIVPREACDTDGKIQSLSITSGAYTVEALDVEKQTLEFDHNPYFRRFTDNAPLRVSISFSRGKGNGPQIENLSSQSASFAELVDPAVSDMKAIVEKDQGLDFRYTRPSITVFMVLNETLPVATRMAFSALIQGSELPINAPFEMKSNQFVPSDSFGSLSEEKIPKYSFKKYRTSLPKNVTMRFANSTSEIAKFVAKILETHGVIVKLVDRSSQEPFGIDVRAHGMNNNHPEIGLHLAALSRFSWIPQIPEIKQSLEHAFHADSDAERTAALNSVGLTLLERALIVPLTIRSYIHMYRKDRVAIDEVTTFDGDIPLYRLKVLQ